ncbi:hypothetical protein KSP40_PGU021226 [Platanthera guangdongensis]|uniref:MENTAL domain-containing protein n=1 Tax=Platanthera guangdongensis TaxID=2320717 RepID=A0ABR2MN89_9ASPA
MISGKARLWSRACRWAKILFFLANMLASLLACAPPLLVLLLDLLLPVVLLSASAGGPGFSSSAVAAQFRSYRFGSSLVDLPILSAARSLILLCFYLCWSGGVSHLGVATVCGAASAGYVSLKAVAMFGTEDSPGKRHLLSFRGKERPTVEVLLLSSLALAMAHVLAAYRTSCRERRKQLVYKIDIEAVSAYSVDLSNYHKIALS